MSLQMTRQDGRRNLWQGKTMARRRRAAVSQLAGQQAGQQRPGWLLRSRLGIPHEALVDAADNQLRRCDYEEQGNVRPGKLLELEFHVLLLQREHKRAKAWEVGDAHQLARRRPQALFSHIAARRNAPTMYRQKEMKRWYRRILVALGCDGRAGNGSGLKTRQGRPQFWCGRAPQQQPPRSAHLAHKVLLQQILKVLAVEKVVGGEEKVPAFRRGEKERGSACGWPTRGGGGSHGGGAAPGTASPAEAAKPGQLLGPLVVADGDNLLEALELQHNHLQWSAPASARGRCSGGAGKQGRPDNRARAVARDTGRRKQQQHTSSGFALTPALGPAPLSHPLP